MGHADSAAVGVGEGLPSSLNLHRQSSRDTHSNLVSRLSIHSIHDHNAESLKFRPLPTSVYHASTGQLTPENQEADIG